VLDSFSPLLFILHNSHYDLLETQFRSCYPSAQTPPDPWPRFTRPSVISFPTYIASALLLLHPRHNDLFAIHPQTQCAPDSEPPCFWITLTGFSFTKYPLFSDFISLSTYSEAHLIPLLVILYLLFFFGAWHIVYFCLCENSGLCVFCISQSHQWEQCEPDKNCSINIWWMNEEISHMRSMGNVKPQSPSLMQTPVRAGNACCGLFQVGRENQLCSERNFYVSHSNKMSRKISEKGA
jgi:hypothetical protein